VRRLFALIAAVVCVAPRGALAADNPMRRGIDPVTDKLALTLDGFASEEGARTSPKGSWRAFFALDYVSGLMSLKIGDLKTDNLIRDRVDLHLMGSYAITDWAEVAADLPFTAYQKNGFAALQAATGFIDAKPAAWGLGDIRAMGKFRILNEDKYYVTLSAIAEVRLPSGADSSFLGERSVLVYPRAVVEHTFLKKLRVAVDAGYRYRALPGRYLNLYVGDELAFAAAASYDLPELFKRQWSVNAEVLFSTPARAPFRSGSQDSLKTPFEGLAGLKVQLHGNWYASVGVGSGFLGETGLGREGFRFFVTVGYARVIRDRDGDGIPDDVDQCPDQKEDFDGFQDEDGCPDLDNDKDGIPDTLDACPNTPGVKKFRGCPDTDGDGIPDWADHCPKQPGPVEYDGCPDTDGDEIPDNEDRCPNEPGPASNDGCPLQKPVVVYDNGKLLLKDSVHFDTGKATIKSNSLPILDEVINVLVAHPEVKKMRVDGHTDNVGPAAFNQDLSQRRAQAVVDYLVSKGIDPARLSAKGFGLDRPIANNATALGRAKNRRVECAILE
jgi:outer membrane protein OmpA-like peptidoglycan-associated protein